MALILSIETSASACSVALHSGGQLLHEIEVAEQQAHAARLAVLVQQMFKATSISAKELAAIAVSSGPGSYTGLRIGTSVAKGLCMGLEIPLISVETLTAMAYHLSGADQSAFLCPMIDARRMEVYAQMFDGNANAVSATEAIIIDKDSFHELLERQPVLFFGDGAGKCKDVIRHRNAQFVDGLYPKASFVGAVAWQHFQNRNFADLVAFTPFYLKEFVAKKAQPVF